MAIVAGVEDVQVRETTRVAAGPRAETHFVINDGLFGGGAGVKDLGGRDVCVCVCVCAYVWCVCVE